MMLISQIAPSLIAAGKSAIQGKQAQELGKSKRPEYQIPEAQKQALQQARYVAGMRELPGQNLMEGRLGENLGKGISDLRNVASNPSDMASNVARMYSANTNAVNDIGMSASRQWLQNQGILSSQLGQMAQAQDKQFDVNQMQPYLANKAAESALREGSFRNLYAAGMNVASGLGGAANLQQEEINYNKLLDKMYGGTKTPNGAGQTAATTQTAAPVFSDPIVGGGQQFDFNAAATKAGMRRFDYGTNTYTN